MLVVIVFGSAKTWGYPPNLAQILGLWVTCGGKMMWLCRVWGWQPPQTASHIHIRHIQSVWAHWYAIHRHVVAALHSIPTLHGSDFGVLGHLLSQMMSLCHVWGWQPPQTAFHIHIRHVQNVWSHWYAVHWHTVWPLHSYTHPTFLRFGVLGHLWSQMMWLCHGWGRHPTQTNSHIHIMHMQSVWAHCYAVHMHMVAALHSYTHPTLLRFWGSGSLVESKWCDYVMVHQK